MSDYLKNLFSLQGKVAVVTGGAGVLGSEMARALSLAGAKVVILGRRKELSETVATACGGQDKAIAVCADVTSEVSIQGAYEEILNHWGQIDILVNAAGGNMPGATIRPDQTFQDLQLDQMKQVVDLNLFGTVIPTMIFSKNMAERGTGVIVNISSMAAQRTITRVLGYSASKAAIDNYTKWMSVEMALKFGEGIRVNAIAPGFFIGEQNRSLLTNPDGTFTPRGETVIAQTPMKRFGKSDELGGTLVWLCSDASKFVTGTVVSVDGGFSAFSGV